MDFSTERIGAGVGFVGDITRLRLSYDATEAGAPATIVAKLPTMEPRRRMMGTGARFFEREIRFHHDIAPGIGVRTPRFSSEPPLPTMDGTCCCSRISRRPSPATNSGDARSSRRRQRCG